jgi:hypothetical protein
METKKGDLKQFWIPFIKLHDTLWEYPPLCVAAITGLKQFKIAAVAMVTKLNNVKFTPNFTYC